MICRPLTASSIPLNSTIDLLRGKPSNPTSTTAAQNRSTDISPSRRAVNGLSKVEGEALLTRFPIIETGNLDYQARDIVALVARVVIEERPVDFYVTHLYMSRGDDSLRLFQVQQLLQWIDSRADGTPAIVCGDFNATLDASSAGLMATRFRPTQTMPTAFTPLADRNGAVSHPDRPRMDRCIDYIWISDGIEVLASEVCFNRPSPDDPSLWPSDHAGVWADLRI